MKVLSLFNGISCGRVALDRAGIPVERYVSYEIDKYANATAQKNYPNDEYYGDVFTADFSQYRGFDLLIGGSPCTHWSIAKNNRETTPDGIGGRMFMQFVHALRGSGCEYFLYENVYSMSNAIKDFITAQLKVEPIMINSALVSAQQRKRLYWTNIPNVTQPADKGIILSDILEGAIGYQDKAHCLTANYNKGVLHNSLERSQRSFVAEPVCLNTTEDGKAQTIKAQMANTSIANICHKGSYGTTGIAVPVGAAQRGRYIQSGNRSKKVEGGTEQYIELRKDDKSNCLTTVTKDSLVAMPINTADDGNKSRTVMAGYYKYGEATIIKNKGFKGGATAVAEPVRLGHISNTNSQANRVYSVRGKSVCLQSQSGGGGAKTGLYKIDLPDGDYIIRKLTPVEAERLQTLPDNYTEGVSNTQRYKQIGNGWTVDVIAHILSGIKNADKTPAFKCDYCDSDVYLGDTYYHIPNLVLFGMKYRMCGKCMSDYLCTS